MIPSELSHLRTVHISLHKNVILEEHSYQQTVLTWTICLDTEVGIADRQDPMGLCSSLHPSVYFIFCVSDSAMRQGSDHGNRRWGKKGLRRPVFSDRAQIPLHRKHTMFFYVYRNMDIPKKPLIHIKEHHPSFFQVSSQTERFERFWGLYLILGFEWDLQ